ncbi:delta-1-pyrroline-5-carboxylate synthase-like protein [Tanacetum coccineum]|uniref:Delta-1-pyrroline-5-carboxylate synthase-like protein n=1 Tax=Tanacetum coccineum TaxID=301880 RepID=A0ABQ5E180_9ASTR
MTLAFIAARPPCFDLSSFVKKITLLSQFEYGKIVQYYGEDKGAERVHVYHPWCRHYSKGKKTFVRGKDHFVDDTLGCEEKESTLAYYHRIHGNKWAEIAKHLPERLVLPTELADGFSLEKMSSPLGVLVIFESRSEALVQI